MTGALKTRAEGKEGGGGGFPFCPGWALHCRLKETSLSPNEMMRCQTGRSSKSKLTTGKPVQRPLENTSWEQHGQGDYEMKPVELQMQFRTSCLGLWKRARRRGAPKQNRH